MFIWVALWAIGSAPALINYNLTGDSLVHCLKYSGSSLLVVDAEIKNRVVDFRGIVTKDLGMEIVILDDHIKSQIARFSPDRPDDALRKDVKGEDTQALIYTR